MLLPNQLSVFMRLGNHVGKMYKALRNFNLVGMQAVVEKLLRAFFQSRMIFSEKLPLLLFLPRLKSVQVISFLQFS